MGATGGGAGGGAGFLGMGAAGAAGSFLPAAIALVGVKLASEAVRMSFRELAEAVHRGAKLYESSARVGRPAGQLFGIKSALESVGISGEQAEMLMLNTQFPRGGVSGGRSSFMSPASRTGQGQVSLDVAGEILSSGRGIFSKGELQQLANMSEEVNFYLKDSIIDINNAGMSARQNFLTAFDFSRLKREWESTWESAAALIGPIIKESIIDPLIMVAQVINLELGNWLALGQKLGIIPKAQPFKPVLGGGSDKLNTNAWQKMGFQMRGEPNSDYARRAAVGIEKLVSIATLKPAAGSNPFVYGQPNYNMP
jgi:hypothetical protein